jgi:hypothetical membrane protein
MDLTAWPTTRQVRRPSARGPARAVGYAVAGLLAGVCYSSFLLARPLGSRLSLTESYVSELEVAGQPASAFFRLTDVVAALLIVVLAIALVRRLARERPAEMRATVGCLFLAGLGLAAAADALFPMSCTPSTSEACRREVDDVAIIAQLHQGHTLSSVLGVFAAQAAMLLLGVSPRVRRRWPALARASLACGLALVVLGLSEVPLSTQHRLGAIERLHVLLISAWLATLGWWLSRPPRGGPD